MMARLDLVETIPSTLEVGRESTEQGDWLWFFNSNQEIRSYGVRPGLGPASCNFKLGHLML